MKILLCKVGMEIKLYEKKKLITVVKELSLSSKYTLKKSLTPKNPKGPNAHCKKLPPYATLFYLRIETKYAYCD